MKRLLLSLGLLLLAFVLAACGGLAGEPEIIGQMPTAAPQQILAAPDFEPNLAEGAQLFAENCVRCHGLTGAGDGEFVLSGQITDIPNFTDPAFHVGRSAEEYYTAVTLGRLEKLMPPFNSLSDAQRWSVANYVFTLAGASAPLPVTTENAVEPTNPHAEATQSAEATVSPEATAEVHTSAVGSITGHIINGTEGGTIPVGSTVSLQIVDMLGTENTLTANVNEDGSYQFTELEIIESSAYRVSIEYAGGTFSSEFIVGTPATPEMTLDTTIYETTDDASVLQINLVLTQIDQINANTLQVWQMINLTNLSDKLFIGQSPSGRRVSVRVPVPLGFNLSPDNDLDRFSFDSEGSSIYDTRPIVPFIEHSFHLIYTVPFSGSVDVSQLFDYDFFGPYEVYVDASNLKITGNGWQDLGTQTVSDNAGNPINYTGIGMTEGSATGLNLFYTVSSTTATPINRNTIGYVLMALGALLILGATIVYWRGRNAKPLEAAPVDASPVSPSSTEVLLQAIANLDEKFEAKQISKKAYEKERQVLKAQLKSAMKDAQ